MIQHLLIKIALFLCIICIPFELRGLFYEHIFDGYFNSVYILTVDPKEHVIVPVRSSGEAIARETVATLATRYGALAAINGGFWKANGSPAGILKINCLWYGTPIKPRGAIGWSLDGQKVLIDRVLTNYHLHDSLDVNEIKVIPVSTPPYTTSEEWQELAHIVGGTPVLVKDGIVVDDYSAEKTLESFLVKKHPRTAIGIRGNGEWVFVVVDGYFYGLLGGMTIKELAELMLNLGCIEALNLDGGGSSTMVVDGIVINHPCGKLREGEKNVEAVSDAILILPSR